MWQEAKRQERAIRSAMVNYKKRAERRRDYYEKIKQDPIKFLRVYGRPSKIHYDVETAAAAENPRNMVPWIGDKSIIIDRFDARSNLDLIEVNFTKADRPAISREAQIEERMCHYERYRCLVQNDFAAITEDMVLRQIEIEEKFGGEEDNKKRKEEEEKKKKLQASKAAIGYVYDDSTDFPDVTPDVVNDQDDEDSEADSDMDIDVEIDPDELSDEHRKSINKSSNAYGMRAHDFLRLLRRDKEVEEEVRRAKQLEEEKAQFSGKKSRRERRILKEQRLRDKHLKQPPKFNPGALGSMYTTSDNPFSGVLSSASSSDSSRSGSVSPPVGRQQFITSFGNGDEEGEPSPPAADQEAGAIVGPQLPPMSAAARNLPFRASRKPWRRPDDDERFGEWRITSKDRRSRSRTRSRSPVTSPPRFRQAQFDRRPTSRSRSRSPDRRRDWQSRNRVSRRSTASRSRSRSRSPSRASPGYRRPPPGNGGAWRYVGRRRGSTRSRSPSPGPRHSGNVRSSSPHTAHRNAAGASNESAAAKAQTGPAIVKRYYRPELEDKSSDSASDSDQLAMDSLNRSGHSNTGDRQGGSDGRSSQAGGQSSRSYPYSKSSIKMTPQEKLRLKMQLALSKTHLADKKAEKEKLQKIEKERKDRDEEMRQMVVLRRQRERERRRRELEGEEVTSGGEGDHGRKSTGLTGGFVGGLIRSSSSSSSSSRGRSSSEEDDRRRRHRSRSHSKSPRPSSHGEDTGRWSRRSPVYSHSSSSRDNFYSNRQRGYGRPARQQASRARYTGGFSADRYPDYEARRRDHHNSSSSGSWSGQRRDYSDSRR